MISRLSKNTYKNLFVFSVKLGIKALSRGLITKESIKRIFCPLDVSRYYELPRVIRALKLKNGSRILDISSPKLITYYLAEKFPGIKLYAIDKYKGELDSWKNIAQPPRNLKIIVGDATKLNFRKEYFDEAYSISVIEHVGDSKKHKDSKMVEEIYRVLKKGGRFIFTTVISNKEKIYFKSKNIYSANKTKKKQIFFYRLYTPNSIKQRLLNIASFQPKYMEVCNYRFPFYEYVFNKLMPLSLFAGWLNYFIAPKLINITKNIKHTGKRAEYFAILQKK
jgi:ubiquinone/menaquinone biosynthesis C-methylase UbiE